MGESVDQGRRKDREQKGQIGLGNSLKARADKMGLTQVERAQGERMEVGN